MCFLTCPICCLPHFFDNSHGLHKQARTGTLKPRALSRDAQILTRAPKSDDVDRSDLCAVNPGNVSEVLHVRKTLFRHLNRELFDLAGPYGEDSVNS